VTIGFDLSDRTGVYVALDARGEVVEEGTVPLEHLGLERAFAGREPTRIAIEVGTHSAWVSRALEAMGHEVVVANARQLRLISHSLKKTDRLDAETLARLVRFDPALLKPIHHRGAQAQADLTQIRARKALVEARTALINATRGMVKAAGGRLPKCSADCFADKADAHVPELLQVAVEPLLASIGQLTEAIAVCTRRLTRLAREHYPETTLLMQVCGVGPLVSLTYVLTLEGPQRFSSSRAVGSYLGLVSRQRDSGAQKPQLHITKAGDVYLRTLLVQAAHHILGQFGKDSDLRRWGLKLAGGSGNKILKKKAVIAVARKLAVLLHRLWLTAEVYDPLRQARREEEAA
jgi:transposase